MRKIYYLITAVLVISLLVASVSAASPWIGNKSSIGGKTYSQTFTPKNVNDLSIGIGLYKEKTLANVMTPPVTKPFMGKWYKTYADVFKISWK